MDKAGVATDARVTTDRWAECVARSRRNAELDRHMHESRDNWGPCCSGCQWSGQPHKPCAVCKGGL